MGLFSRKKKPAEPAPELPQEVDRVTVEEQIPEDVTAPETEQATENEPAPEVVVTSSETEGPETEQAPDTEKPAYDEDHMVLSTDNLVKIYGRRTVVDHVSINVRQGEIVGLLGPNGAGKTTTFYMATGLINHNQGRIFLNDLNITS